MRDPVHALVAITVLISSPLVSAQTKVDFARDVQPILSDNCYACHGPDANTRKAGLRLDDRAAAVAVRDGRAAIVPGDPAASELLRRVVATDRKTRMPPASSGKQLSAAQVETLRQWIAQGAKWGRHWAFVPPRRPEVPDLSKDPLAAKFDMGGHNPIDAFVNARLAQAMLRRKPEADRRTLIRRVTFDLTGLPPTPKAVDAFLADRAPGAYERLVERLLASERYGERMAMVWLDAARYADTDGYQADATRANWPWRDWLVDAYNANMPFDAMTRLQFAGDLLPKATPEQILATCFHRNHMTNGEGGRLAEESRIEYVIDRVNTVGTAYLGMTLGCAQCHDHKFDPVSQKDYYGLNAFFNSIDETGGAGPGARPHLKYRSPRVAAGLRASAKWLQAKRAELARVEAEAKRGVDAWLDALGKDVRSGERVRSFHRAKIRELGSTHGSVLREGTDGTVAVTGPNPRHEDYLLGVRPALARITGMRLDVLPGADGRLSQAADGHVILTNLKVSVRKRGRPEVRELAIRWSSADYQARKKGDKAYGPVRDVLDDDPRTGWATWGSDAKQARAAVFGFAEPVVLAAEEELLVELRHRSLRGNSNIRRFRLSFTDEVGPTLRRVGKTPLEQLVAVGGQPARLDAKVRSAFVQQYLAGHAAVLRAREVERLARRRHDRYRRAGVAKVQVLGERKKPRRTHVLKRGVWDQKGDVVERSVPEALGAWPKGLPKTRLGLARWLTNGKHPLTARVAVNRYWQMYFGQGLVRTPEDFGRQGERPTHPELLDWLACEFVASGWNIKHIQKLIIMSAVYRQAAADIRDTALRQRDPQNRLLACAPRFRLPAWMIRDAALAASGLLSTRIGGPPVFPHQPPGVWQAFTMGRFRYEPSVGDDIHRRSIYSFWRRLVAPTGMFDASRRRTCQIRVIRTNTPLQALTVMNDVTFIEAARVLAAKTMTAHEGDGARLRAMFVRVLGRNPNERELRALSRQLQAARGHYRDRGEAARMLVSAGSAPGASLDPVAHAAFTLAASTIFNLDEALIRQ